MRRSIILTVSLAAILVFVGAPNRAVKADLSPVEMIKNAKTPVHLHSLAGGDSLVHQEATQVDNWWMSIYPDQTYPHVWQVTAEKENGTFGLNPSDRLLVQHKGPGSDTSSIWVHVLEVTKTLILTLEPDHLDTMYVDYTGGYDSLMMDIPNYQPVCTWWHEIRPNFCQFWHINSWVDSGEPFGELSYCDTIDMAKAEDIEWWHVIRVEEIPPDLFLHLEDLEDPTDTMVLTFSGGVDPDSLNRALTEPVCTWWHEEWPDFCDWWHIKSWHDNGNAILDSCDTLDMVNLENITWWHVEDVAIDIQVDSINPPDPIPSITSWGLIILAVLIAGSAVLIWLRRRRITVSP